MAFRPDTRVGFERPVHRSWNVRWLLPGLLAGAVVHFVYLQTHPYPAFGAGLFLLIAEQIGQHGYQLPATIPYYAEPIPLAYPPLMFYAVALLRDATGLGGIAIARYLPGVVTVLALIPFYLFVDELLDSPRIAGVATFLVAVSPPVLQWQLSAGGIVRAPAALLLTTALYTGLLLFKDGGRQWLAASVGLFALLVLTHPIYAVFGGLSYVWLYVSFSRSARGLVDGAVVALGGLALTSPWWTIVVERFGADVFTGAAGTHGGIGKQLPSLITLFNSSLFHPSLDSVSQSGVLFNVQPRLFHLLSGGTILVFGWLLFIVVSTVHLSVRNDVRASDRTLFLSGWLLLSMAVVSKLRFSFLIGAIVFAVIIVEYAIPALERGAEPPVRRRAVAPAVLLAIALVGLAVGGLYAASELDSHAGSASQPQFVGDADLAAMNWAASNTDPAARFVVIGDAAEWFPYGSHRRILIGPWGIEWHGQAAYQEQLRQFNTLSTCQHEACVSSTLLSADVDPDYLYVPTSEYTVRGMKTHPAPMLREELIQSPHYRLVHENEGVVVFAVDLDPMDPSALDRPDTRVAPTPDSRPISGVGPNAGVGFSRFS